MPVWDVTSRFHLFLQTFGVPALLRCDKGFALQPVPLRRKDLAVLIFLSVEGRRTYPRGLLASMLWGDTSEERARHSLTQALARLRHVLGPEVFELTSDSVLWRDVVRSDVTALKEAAGETADWPKSAFLADFNVGRGGAEFEIWAEEKRTYYRTLVLQHLEQCGRRAEEQQAWEEALASGQRALEVDPIDEASLRRVMRAWAAMGERGLALQRYRSMKRWLESEFDSEPEALTTSLAEELMAATLEAADGSSSHQRSRRSPMGRGPQPTWSMAQPPAAGPSVSGEDGPVSVSGKPRLGRHAIALAVGVVLLLATALGPWFLLDADEVIDMPGNGQPVLLQGETHPQLAYDGTFFRFPDWETFMACSGWQPGLIRTLPRVPGATPDAVLPSVLENFAVAGHGLVRTQSVAGGYYVVVGCVKSPVPDPSLAGFSPLGPIQVVADSVLDRLPTGPPLLGPVRRAGTVLTERGGGRMRWVLFAGGALDVPSMRILASHCRSTFVEVDRAELESYRVTGALRRADAPCGHRAVQKAWHPAAAASTDGREPGALN